MKAYEDLTYRGQARRLRAIAEEAIERSAVRHDRLELIFHGENTTFRVRNRDAGDYLVRIHRPGYQNRRTIASELEFLAAVRAETDLLVPRPVGGRDAAVHRIEAPGVEARNVVLFEWLPGRFTSHFSPFTMRRLGRFVAKLHQFADDFVPSGRFERQFWHIEGLTGENMGGSLELLPDGHRGLADEVVGRAYEVFDALGRGRDVWGLIHADLHHGNRLLSNGEVGAIDFDDMGFGYHLYDFAVIFGYPLRQRPEAYDELREAFLNGYREVRPMPDEYVALLPAFFAMRYLAITLWVLGRAADNPYFAKRAKEEEPYFLDELGEVAALEW